MLSRSRASQSKLSSADAESRVQVAPKVVEARVDRLFGVDVDDVERTPAEKWHAPLREPHAERRAPRRREIVVASRQLVVRGRDHRRLTERVCHRAHQTHGKQSENECTEPADHGGMLTQFKAKFPGDSRFGGTM